MSSVHSFTQAAYLKMLSSSFFYPSSKELRPIESKGSISKSIQTNAELFNAKVSSSKWVKYGAPVRFVARLVYGVALGSIVSPVGVAYNGFATIYFCAVWYRGDKASADQNWNKVKMCATNFAQDLCITAVTYWGLISVKWLKDAFQFKYLLNEGEARFIVYGIGISLTSFISFAAEPDIQIPFLFQNPSERAAIYKTIKLRTEFGIVEKKTKGLLPYDVDLDNEDYKTLKGTLCDLWKCQGIDLLLLLKQIKSYSQPSLQFPGIENQLSRLGHNYIGSQVNVFLDRAIILAKLQSEKERLKNLKTKYNNLAENMGKVNKLLGECLSIMHASDKKRFSILFPFSEQVIKEFLDTNYQIPDNIDNSPQAQWERIIKKQGLPETLTIKEPTCVEVYNKIKEGKTPFEIFGFKPGDKPDEITIRRKYRQLMLRVHPDKFLDEKKEKVEATSLFRIITEAYNLLNKEFCSQ